jgi:hypothetical protein
MLCVSDQLMDQCILRRFSIGLKFARGFSLSGHVVPICADTVSLAKAGAKDRMCTRNVIVDKEDEE